MCFESCHCRKTLRDLKIRKYIHIDSVAELVDALDWKSCELRSCRFESCHCLDDVVKLVRHASLEN